MCTIGSTVARALIDVAGTAVGLINQQSEAKANNQYRVQVALNNAKNANEEALRQKQLGINKSRQDKINGLYEASRLKAQNSASGLDIQSQTSEMAYQDILNNSFDSAENTKSEYDRVANSYFNQANSYLKEANVNNKQYNNSVFSNALNALGKTGRVTSSWYDDLKGRFEK